MKEIEIPERYEARIEGNKVIFVPKESKDERIRKEILEYFNQFKDEGLRGVNITDWIAYLEKQKEQKPVEIHIDNPNIQKFDPDVKVTTSDSSASGKELLYVSNKSYKIGYRDGVNSVKPAEWGEEDEDCYNEICRIINNFADSPEQNRELTDWLIKTVYKQ